ncbi:acetolactate decarboxylase [Pontibacter indicus]|uniref:Acetolactate decarboxylase n=1 Tax=Pontibacter indicus TaxID=1317125 RepID=A0A1R3WSE2_9BACT|nr:acetolactate decarboxylase [Pontibacter indicus]SIT80827.1 acetolactate decarboxylase [Pontibacter indicus]
MKHLTFSALTLTSVILLGSCATNTTENTDIASGEVHVVGAMRNVMWKGELGGTIDLDTLSAKKHLIGLGPVEYLAGEMMIVDGKSYKSVVTSDSTMRVEETFAAKAPFFVYAQVPEWQERAVPDSVQNLQQLELYLDAETKNSKRPFPFKLSGEVETATIHIVNLPAGSTVSNPDEAHQGQVNYELEQEEVEVAGFFSTEHKAVFTHHDTFMHLHLLTKDRSKMGHLDEVVFKPGSLTLYLPKE